MVLTNFYFGATFSLQFISLLPCNIFLSALAAIPVPQTATGDNYHSPLGVTSAYLPYFRNKNTPRSKLTLDVVIPVFAEASTLPCLKHGTGRKTPGTLSIQMIIRQIHCDNIPDSKYATESSD